MNRQLQIRLRTTFQRLNTVAASHAFPHIRALAENLERIAPNTPGQVRITPKTAELFATASVDIWLRAVHSFLISTALSKASPLWASVIGYYSSHYSIRAFSHLLGYFLLFNKKKVVRWTLENGQHICAYSPRGGGDREHKLYWNLVKRDEHFEADPMFCEYNTSLDASDARHRDRANYSDHLFPYPEFRVLSKSELKERVQLISQIEFQDPPIPEVSQFIDLQSVQIVAYHRLVKYRQFVDEILRRGKSFLERTSKPQFC